MLTGKARLAGVIGWPVGHSRSPALHGFWLREHGIDGAYVPLAVRPENLKSALAGLAALGFRGANVTVPHKEAALSLVDRASDTALRIGAVNTITVAEDGTLEGNNTDAFGFLENLREAQPGWRAATGAAAVIGAGGAARAIAVALANEGAPEIRIVNRTKERADRLVQEIGRPLVAIDWANRAAALVDVSLLVNATTQGMSGEQPLDLDLARLPTNALVNDIVYVPLETGLLAAARARGNRIVDGLGMLLHQARPGFAAWFGVEPKVTPALREAVLASQPG
ncbi:MAG: shikimate dehydrogenase [Rhodospirillaceae bacterium]|nr:shikimate dehydrogenase [Rhodospirillaceae bacterium]